MTKKVNKLSDLEIDEVSLVDTGANQHASVEFFKNLDGEDADGDDDVTDEEATHDSFFSKLVNKVLRTDFTTSQDDDGTMTEVDKLNPGPQMPYGQQPQAQPAPGPQNQMPEGAQAFPADPAMGEMPAEMEAGPPLPDEVIDYIQQLEEQLAQALGQAGEGDQVHQEEDQMVGKQYNDEDEVAFLTELAKSLQDEDQRESFEKAEQLVKKANERAEAAETIAKAERDHRLTQEFVAKARAFSNLPVDAHEFGPVLKRLHDTMDEADVEMIEKALSTANESVSNFFGEIGKRGDNAVLSDRLESVAKSMVDANSELTLEQARSRALEQDPGLYDEFLQDQGR